MQWHLVHEREVADDPLQATLYLDAQLARSVAQVAFTQSPRKDKAIT